MLEASEWETALGVVGGQLLFHGIRTPRTTRTRRGMRPRMGETTVS